MLDRRIITAHTRWCVSLNGLYLRLVNTIYELLFALKLVAVGNVVLSLLSDVFVEAGALVCCVVIEHAGIFLIYFLDHFDRWNSTPCAKIISFTMTFSLLLMILWLLIVVRCILCFFLFDWVCLYNFWYRYFSHWHSFVNDKHIFIIWVSWRNTVIPVLLSRCSLSHLFLLWNLFLNWFAFLSHFIIDLV